MATKNEKLYFVYNGISCREFNLINVNTGSGMYEEVFVSSREIIETTVKGSDTPLFHGLEETPLEFTLNLAFQGYYTDRQIEDVVLWLFEDEYYKPLYFEENPDKIYYCIPNSDSTVVHNGLNQGYITINMRCRSSKIMSPTIVTQTYDLSTIISPYEITINNSGHKEIYPEISILKIGVGNIVFTRLEDGQIFEIRNLANQEDIYVDCEKEIIESDIPGIYRYEDIVGEYHDMILNRGINTFSINGNCKITFRYRFKYLF